MDGPSNSSTFRIPFDASQLAYHERITYDNNGRQVYERVLAAPGVERGDGLTTGQRPTDGNLVRNNGGLSESTTPPDIVPTPEHQGANTPLSYRQRRTANRRRAHQNRNAQRRRMLQSRGRVMRVPGTNEDGSTSTQSSAQLPSDNYQMSEHTVPITYTGSLALISQNYAHMESLEGPGLTNAPTAGHDASRLPTDNNATSEHTVPTTIERIREQLDSGELEINATNGTQADQMETSRTGSGLNSLFPNPSSLSLISQNYGEIEDNVQSPLPPAFQHPNINTDRRRRLQHDTNPYSTEPSRRRDENTNQDIDQLAQRVRSDPPIGTGETSVFLMSFPEASMAEAIDGMERYNIEPNQWEASGKWKATGQTRCFLRGFDHLHTVHYRVQIEDSSDLPTIVQESWFNVFSFNGLKSRRHTLYHALDLSRILRLLLLGTFVESVPSARSRVHEDHRVALSQRNLIIEAFEHKIVREKVYEILSETLRGRLHQEMHYVGWVGELSDLQ